MIDLAVSTQRREGEAPSLERFILPKPSQDFIKLLSLANTINSDMRGSQRSSDRVVEALESGENLMSSRLQSAAVRNLNPEIPTVIISHPYFDRSTNFINSERISLLKHYEDTNPYRAILEEEIAYHLAVNLADPQSTRVIFAKYALSIDGNILENELRVEDALAWAIGNGYQVIVTAPVKISKSSGSWEIDLSEEGDTCRYLEHFALNLEGRVAIQPTIERSGYLPGFPTSRELNDSHPMLLDLFNIGDFYSRVKTLIASGGYLFCPSNSYLQCLGHTLIQTLTLRDRTATELTPSLNIQFNKDLLYVRRPQTKATLSPTQYRDLIRTYLELDCYDVTSSEAAIRRGFIRSSIQNLYLSRPSIDSITRELQRVKFRRKLDSLCELSLT